MTSRKKPGVAFWATVVVVVVLVAYPLSFGPAMWFTVRSGDSVRYACGVVYAPMFWLDEHAPVPVQATIRWYSDLWVFGI